MKIPFSPPFIDQDVIAEVVNTLESGWITTGPKVKALEDEVVKLTGVSSALCVNSWTSGAILILKWFGIKEGDEVIIPSYTYSATALAVLHCGATPVMVDVKDDFTADPETGENSGQVLVVTQLVEGNTCHIAYVDARANDNANELARAAADASGSFDCASDDVEIIGKFTAW